MPKRGKRRQDHFARKARAHGYPARSVYKLEAIDRRYSLLSRNVRVLDLGAAPGSWTMYCARYVGPGGFVCAVDLTEMSVGASPNAARVECVQGDFTESETANRIEAYAPFDIVLSDAAPATSGNRLVDTARSESIVESIFARLDRWLIEGGACVCKLFQGGGEQRLLAQARDIFERAHAYRPDAVRNESFEIYLIGVRYTNKEAVSDLRQPQS